MSFFLQKLKIKKNMGLSRPQAGMTYVELIVVLSIFAVMSSIVVFSYRSFQMKVDIKSLASDIALKIVEAQKSSLSGVLQPTSFTSKPSYGVYFDSSTPTSFIYFADYDGSHTFSSTSCAGECLSVFSIPKNDTIYKFYYTFSDDTKPNMNILNDLNITFSRPSSNAILWSGGTPLPATIDHVGIIVASPDLSANAIIKVYPSGRIQVN